MLIYTYNVIKKGKNVKRRDLIAEIEKLGYKFLREGGNHTVYSNGKRKEEISRQKEIREILAMKILKRCKEG